MDDKPQDESFGEVIQRPEPAHSPPHSLERYETESDDELEATELRQLSQEIERLPPVSHIISPGKPMVHWYDPIRKFWRHEVRISVPHEDCRDHLGESLRHILSDNVSRGTNRNVKDPWLGVAVSISNLIDEDNPH
jgi:hypothetical protein